MNLFIKSNLLVIIPAAAIVVSGCYTQLESSRSYGYYDDYEDAIEEGTEDDSAYVAEEDYDFARDQFYYDYYYPSTTISLGVGYYPTWASGWYYGGYYPGWCWSYSPWYAWCSPYYYGGFYPYYGYSGYGYSGYGVGYAWRSRDYGTTRTFGNTRGSGATRGYSDGSRRSGDVDINLPTASRSGRSREAEVKPRTSRGSTVSPGSRTRTGTDVRSTERRSGTREGVRGNSQPARRPSRSIVPRNSGTGSSAPAQSPPRVSSPPSRAGGSSYTPGSQPSRPSAPAPSGGSTRSNGGSRGGRK